MSPRPKASDWMNTASDGEDDVINQGYSSEEDQRTRVSRPTKRRRLSPADEDDEEDEENEYFSGEEEVQRPANGRRKRVEEDSEMEADFDDDELEDDDEDDEDEAERSLPAIASKSLNKLSETAASPKSSKTKSSSLPISLDITDPTKLFNLKQPPLKKTGVLYLSRIPPYMTPSQIRHLLTPFGTVNRIFLSPEPQHLYQKRIKFGGNKKRQFVEGWVEFVKKKDAKWCAESLNAQQVGGKKGGWWYDDIWNLKYLSGFKWGDLTEQIANENAARQARLRAEISQATRENKTYIRNVERAKMVENMQTAAKEKKRKIGDSEEPSATVTAPGEKDKIRRTFTQRTAVTKTVKDGERKKGPEKSEAMKKLLSSVF